MLSSNQVCGSAVTPATCPYHLNTHMTRPMGRDTDFLNLVCFLGNNRKEMVVNRMGSARLKGKAIFKNFIVYVKV